MEKKINDIIQFFIDNSIILDSQIEEICAFKEEYRNFVRIIFKTLAEGNYKDKKMAVTFIDVNKMDFFDDEGAVVGMYVSSYKLINENDGNVYLSIDPDESTRDKSKKDGGVVICKDIDYRCL